MSRTTSIEVERIAMPSMIKLCMIGGMVAGAVLCTLAAVVDLIDGVLFWHSLFGVSVGSLVGAPFGGALAGAVLGLACGLYFAIGLWFWGWLRPTTVRYVVPPGSEGG